MFCASCIRKTLTLKLIPATPARLGVEPEDIVGVASRRGEVRVKAVVLASLQPGQIFMPMHYPETNLLTHDSFDPHSKEPNYKACAVSIRAQMRSRNAGANPNAIV